MNSPSFKDIMMLAYSKRQETTPHEMVSMSLAWGIFRMELELFEARERHEQEIMGADYKPFAERYCTAEGLRQGRFSKQEKV